MDITKSHEAFEKWLESENKSNFRELLTRGFLRLYLHDSTQSQWEIWKAAREALEVELPTQDEYDDPLSAYNAISDCKKILRTAGIRIKGESE